MPTRCGRCREQLFVAFVSPALSEIRLAELRMNYPTFLFQLSASEVPHFIPRKSLFLLIMP